MHDSVIYISRYPNGHGRIVSYRQRVIPPLSYLNRLVKAAGCCIYAIKQSISLFDLPV